MIPDSHFLKEIQGKLVDMKSQYLTDRTVSIQTVNEAIGIVQREIDREIIRLKLESNKGG
jgi:hypothetical protein